MALEMEMATVQNSGYHASMPQAAPYQAELRANDQYQAPPPAAPEEETDWTQIPDANDRRRLQNRIAQRNYRRKLKRRVEELEHQIYIGFNSKPADQAPPGHDTHTLPPPPKSSGSIGFGMACTDPVQMNMNQDGMFTNQPQGEPLTLQTEHYAHQTSPAQLNQISQQPIQVEQPQNMYQGPYPPLPQVQGAQNLPHAAYMRQSYEDMQQHYHFAQANPLKRPYCEAMYYEGLFSEENPMISGEQMSVSPSMQHVVSQGGFEQVSEHQEIAPPITGTNNSSYHRSHSTASMSRPIVFQASESVAINSAPKSPNTYDAEPRVTEMVSPRSYTGSDTEEMACNSCGPTHKRHRGDHKHHRQPNSQQRYHQHASSQPLSNRDPSPTKQLSPRDIKQSPGPEIRQPIVPCKDSSPSERMAYLLECSRAAGFSDFDSAATEYYTASFEEKSEANLAQKTSRSRRLNKLLASLDKSARSWTRWEAQGYHGEILTSAEAIYVADFHSFSHDESTRQHIQNAAAANSAAERECLDSRSQRPTPPACDMNQVAAPHTPDLSRWFQDKLPKLWALFTELANDQTDNQQDNEWAVTQAIATLACRGGNTTSFGSYY